MLMHWYLTVNTRSCLTCRTYDDIRAPLSDVKPRALAVIIRTLDGVLIRSQFGDRGFLSPPTAKRQYRRSAYIGELCRCSPGFSSVLAQGSDLCCAKDGGAAKIRAMDCCAHLFYLVIDEHHPACIALRRNVFLRGWVRYYRELHFRAFRLTTRYTCSPSHVTRANVEDATDTG